MKLFLFFLFVLLTLTAFSQNDTTDKNSLPTTITNFNTYGYIDGKRLDSIESLYATIGFRSGGGVTFDYGQIRSKNKEYLLTDSKGLPLQFTTTTTGFVLNFFHYNHWEFLNVYVANNSSTGSVASTFLLKKQ